MQNWPLSDADPFLREIQAHASDDEPRLIFADWLEDRGDPQSELIRVQCAPATDCDPAQFHELALREKELVSEFRTRTLQRLGALGVQELVVKRGFVEKVRLNGTAWLNQPWLLFRVAPGLRGVMWRGLRGKQAPEVLTRFLDSPVSGALSSLDVSQNVLSGAAAEAIAANLRTKQLTALHAAENQLSGHGVHVLASSPQVVSLKLLNLSENDLSHQCLRAIAGSPYLKNLETLHADDNPTGNNGLAALAGLMQLVSLRHLSLTHNVIGYDGVRALANSPTLTELLTLNLSGNPLGPAGASMLASSSVCGRLTSLNLRECEIGPEGAKTLAASIHLRSLKSLDLFGNDVGDGALHLAKSVNLTKLEVLELGANDINAAGARALAESPFLSNVRSLRLTLNPLGNSRLLQERFGSALLV